MAKQRLFFQQLTHGLPVLQLVLLHLQHLVAIDVLRRQQHPKQLPWAPCQWLVSRYLTLPNSSSSSSKRAFVEHV
jgi:hypothetical protein